MSTYLPPAVPLEKPRLPERQGYLSRSPTSRESRRGSGQCSLLFCSQNLQSMLYWEVLLGGGPCRVQACRQPQRGPSSGRTLLLPQWFSCIQPWRPSLSGLVPAHTHAHTHTVIVTKLKTAQRSITDLQILDLSMTFTYQHPHRKSLLPAPLRDCVRPPRPPQTAVLALFPEYHP